ncbi:MAG: hypothetical protein K2G36_02865 [Ruminococcus sp.]|nr:hypothetical protein [Ruminococcus sp.]
MRNKFYSVITASLIIATITVPASVSLFGNNSFYNSSTDVIKTSDIIENTPTATETDSKTPVSDIKNSECVYNTLSLHDNELTVLSMDEANEMIQNAEADYNKNGISYISEKKRYAESIMSNINVDSSINKSYIYHMMLNSIDYFNTAKGSIEYSFGGSEPVTTEFFTNISEQYAYEKECLSDGSIDELYVYDGEGYKKNDEYGIYETFICSESGEFNISDNNRVVMLDDGHILNINRKDTTNLAVSGNTCLFPQQFAMSKMYNFDNWNITGYEEIMGRNCAVIEGVTENSKFKMAIDIDYGFMIDYEELSENNDIISYSKVLDLKNDIVVEKRVIESKINNK